MEMNAAYWQRRYEEGSTGWDAGAITTPLKEYFDQLENKDVKILIPGAGNGYEAEYLHGLGFSNVFVVDLAEWPLQNIKQRTPSFPEDHLVLGDFFDLHGQYDLMIEQTFFCAIDPALRSEYVRQSWQLLAPGGQLVGLLWNIPMRADAPPFGGSEAEYHGLFGELFQIEVLEEAYNSIPPRAGSEVFVKFVKA